MEVLNSGVFIDIPMFIEHYVKDDYESNNWPSFDWSILLDNA